MRTLVADLDTLENELVNLFRKSDRNQNGKISFKEARPMIKDVSDFLGLEVPSDGELREGFNELSKLNKADGEIDGEEFAIVAEKFLLPTLVFSYAW